ncbi:hypothetical protein [Paenibacillus sp. Marseille-Q4541]|uniref:hypothetical protein n=1 Tax=Paenibacillus sp. Marseille-Q4541 TaxID=2831522 RepID=UPI001BAC9B46|nr:hypothetical protein [Paenibacillus sp. Marseille-Q4541]
MSDLLSYISYFYECRKIQLLLLLHEKKLPVELLFYNAYESTNLFYDHLFVQDQSRWSYDGYSITREDLELLNVHMEELIIPILSEDELDLLLKERLINNQFIYIWGNLDYLPHWVYGRDYLVKGSLHSVLIKDYQMNEDKTLYLLQDNFPEYCDYVDSSIIKNAIFKGDPEWTHLLTFVRLSGIDEQTIIESITNKFTVWRQNLVDDFQFYDHIQYLIEQEPNDPHAFYERLEHALSLVSGSRYLFSRFLEYTGVSEELVASLDRCGQIAKRMKDAFTKAAISGKINRSKLSPLCTELKHLEMECFQTLTSDNFAPILSIPTLTSSSSRSK